MSASDKKQQRKAAMAEGLSQKQQREQDEARAAKQKKTVYTAVGIVCAVLAVALLVWNGWSSISTKFHNKAVAATVDGVDYTVGDLQYHYAEARQTIYMYTLYGLNFGFNPYVDDGAQWFNEAEGETFADYFREYALSSLKNTAALCAAAKADGYTLSAEGQASVDSQLANYDTARAQAGLSWDNYLSRIFGAGVTKDVLVRNLTNAVLAEEYENYHKESIEVDEAAILDYYNNHTDDLDSYDFRYFFINGTAPSTVDEEGKTKEATDEEKAAALAEAESKANAAVAEIEAAEDKEAAFIATAPKYVSESSRGAYEADPDYSLQSGIIGDRLSSTAYITWLKDAKREVGDVTAIKSDSGYFVVMFLKRERDDIPAVNVRHILVLTDTSDSTENDDNGYAIPTQAARDAAKAKAQEIWDKWLAGEKTEESFAALAEELSEDGRNSETNALNKPGGLYESVFRGDMVPNFNDWIFEPGRQVGEVGMVENVGRYSGWHVIYFSGVTGVPHWKSIAEEETQKSIQDAWSTALLEDCEAVEADGMKYVGSANTATPTPTASPVESEAVESEPVESEPVESQATE